MSDQTSQITDDTLQMIRKAQTAGITSAMGLFGYDLSGPASLVPVNTPWYDRVKRVNSTDGAKVATWRTLMNVNATQPNPFVGFDQGGAYVNFSEMDMFAPYAPVRVTGRVFRDAMDLSKGYDDAHARAVFGTLSQWRIQENKGLLGGQAFALPTIGTPVVAQSDTGGSIAASTAVNVKVAARSGLNYYWGGSGIAGSQGTVTTSTVAAAAHSATVTVAAVRGAVAYDWWVAGFYYTTTITNTVTITAIPTANAGTVPNLPALYTTAPTVLPTADTSYSANSYNGLIASCAGDYGTTGLVTPGSGTTSGCQFTSLNGGTLTANSQGVAEIDAMLLAIWNASQLSPTSIIINGQQAQDIKAKILATNAAVTYLRAGEAGDRDGVIGGGAVAGYVNGASGGDHVGIISDPALPPGRIGFITEQLNYPNQGFSNTFEARCLRDVSEFPYGASVSTTPGANGGPREEWDVSSTETFINRAPVSCGWLTEIAAG
jgi:hypothetical protein